jgi:hypothetical protein
VRMRIALLGPKRQGLLGKGACFRGNKGSAESEVAVSEILTVVIPTGTATFSLKDFKTEMRARSGRSRTALGMATDALPFNPFPLDRIKHLQFCHAVHWT